MIQKQLDGAIEIIFRVAGLDEIKQWVLGLGPEAYVVEPEELRWLVQSDVDKAMGMIFGLAIGDALGRPTEFMSLKNI